MVRPRKIHISKEQMRIWLENGMSYREITREIKKLYGLKFDPSTIYRHTVRLGLKDKNIHKQYKDFCREHKKKVKRINTHLATKANCYMDITEISFRSQKGKHKRSVKRYFVSLKVEKKLYLYYIKDQTKASILTAMIHLKEFMPANPICLVDTQFNPKLPERSEITFCNTEKWHPIKNMVEKHHGFKTNIYAKFWKFKTVSYSKMNDESKRQLLRIYIETIERNEHIEIINKDEMITEICRLAEAQQL